MKWERRCGCGRTLEKPARSDSPVTCVCGWIWRGPEFFGMPTGGYISGKLVYLVGAGWIRRDSAASH